MNKTTLIFRHEFTHEIKKPSYLVMTLIVPVLALLAIGIFKLVFPTVAPAPVDVAVDAPPDLTAGYIGDPNMANIIIPAVFALLLGLSLMLGATSLINGLGEEKESRLIQVLFSSVSIRQLLVGKILAMGLAGLLQVLVWLLSTPLLLRMASASFGGFLSKLQIPVNFLVLGIVYFILGYLLFAVLSVGVGAISSNAKEANSLALFYTLGSFIPLWTSALNMFFPNSPIWVVLTLFPVTAPIMTMMRLGTSTVPVWQIIASIAVLVLSIIGGISLSIRLFRVHMLMTGKRPSFKQLAQSLRESKQEARKAAVAETSEKRSRLYFIDNLRSALAILVVLHHVAITYGAVLPMFYYLEPPFSAPGVIDPTAYTALLALSVLNQAWFMGAFFMLAGYFTPRSYDRKGLGGFVKDKLIRLGIPLAVFSLLINPLSWLGLWLMPVELTGITTPFTWQSYVNFIGLGPLWFVAMLLILNLGYILWRVVSGKQAPTTKKESVPSYLAIGAWTLVLAVASYLMRMVVPIGEQIFGFPTLSYLPQYVGCFVIGTIASRRNWFRTMPASMGIVGLVAALIAGIVLFPVAFSGALFSLDLAAMGNAMGNGHWQSALYALFDAVFSVGLTLGAIIVFRRFFNGAGRLGRFMSKQSYAVYVLHIPVIVVVAYLLRNVTFAPLLKFGLASLVAVPLSFIVAYLVRKIPYVSKVL